MDSLKKHWAVIILAVIILAFAFYWYSWRPTQLMKWCSKTHSSSSEFRPCLFNAGYPVNLNNTVNTNYND